MAGALDTDNTEGLLAGLFAEENEFDRRSLWRIGSWGAVTVGAVVLAVYANQSSLGWRREQIAADDFARQAQQIRQLAHESQVETRKLASAVDTLNGDRDRLYSRVTVLEQGLDSVTGAIAKQPAAAKPVVASAAPDTTAQQGSATPPAPVVGPVATAPAAVTPPAAADKPRAEAAKTEPPVAITSTVPAAPAATPAPLMAAKSMMGPPDPAAPKLVEAAKPAANEPAASSAAATTPPPETVAALPAIEPKAEEADAPQAAVQRTEFAVDLGSANSIGGLRTLWRGVVASNAALKALSPIIMVRENRSGLGMQLRLAAGPLQDAATAAKICAALAEARRGCETTVFDGQRLAMASGERQPMPVTKPEAPALRPVAAKHGLSRQAKKDEPPSKETSTISSWFSNKKP